MMSLNMTDVTLPVCSVIRTESALCRKADEYTNIYCVGLQWSHAVEEYLPSSQSWQALAKDGEEKNKRDKDGFATVK